MTAITPEPYTVRDALVTIDGDTYEGAVTDVAFTPSQSTVTVTAVNGTTYSETSPATWTLDLTFLQSGAADDLLGVLLALKGTKVTVIVQPKSGEVTYTAEVTLAPAKIGGNPGAFADSQVSLPSSEPVPDYTP